MNFFHAVNASVSAPVAPSIPIITTGLYVYLDADNSTSYPGTGTTWYDLSGNNKNGTLINGTSFDSVNKAFDFDGVNDYVDINLSNAPVYSIQVWAYLLTTITNQTPRMGLLRYNNSGGQEGISFGNTTSQVPRERLTMMHSTSNPQTFYRTAQNTTNINAGWHNFVFNWNGTKYDIFMDGIKYLTSSGSQTDVPFIYSNEIFLGQDFLSTLPFFQGKQSVFALYTSSLTDAEVVSNFNALRGRYGL